jgi:LuxR family transcriptional regulator, maltose regulon positive regulatory protein
MPPRPRAGTLRRAGLIGRLNEGLGKRLILVSAPAGFGKTTLVSAWVNAGGFPFAWLTLDKNDNDPVRFWTYLISAVRTLNPGVGKAALSTLASGQPSSPESFLTPFINDLRRLQESSVLVLEDFHVVTSREIQESLWFLVQNLPDTLHLVIVTRKDPDMPVATLRARDDLLEITAAQLRWNAEETAAFLKETLHADVPPDVATMLYERTEGWPAGLRLLSASMRDGIRVESAGLPQAGNDRYVTEYLVEEVIDTQPAPVQSFLLSTCFFSRLTGALCDRLTGQEDGASMLERIERDGLFLVPLEQRGVQPWYHYGALFAQSLQHVARQRLGEAEVRGLFENASQWYEANGIYEDAIESALAARLYPRALNLIERFVEIHDIAELLTLRGWLDAIPVEVIHAHPLICFTYAQVLLYSGDRFSPTTPVQLEPLLHAAETAWLAADDREHLGQLHAVQGTIAWWQGDFQKAFQYAQVSLDELPDQDLMYRGSSLLTVSRQALDEGHMAAAQEMVLEARARMGAVRNIHGVLAAIQMLSEIAWWQCQLEQARQLNQQVRDEAIGGAEMLDDQGIAALGLADVAYEQNELKQAEELGTQALDLARTRGNSLLHVAATIRLAWIRAAYGDIQAAAALLNSLAGSFSNSVFMRQVQAEQARLSILASETLSLAAWKATVSNGQANANTVQKEREAFVLARLQLAEGNPAEALATLHGMRADASQNGRLRSEVEACILEALAFHAQSRLSKATASLLEALKLGQAKGLRRLFLDEGPMLASLLREAIPGIQDRTASLYASTLLHLFGSGADGSTGSPASGYALSQQEIRVLRLLAAGRSNADMAQELIVSPNTIKSHIKSIYRKLGITSRAEARDVARNLRLL